LQQSEEGARASVKPSLLSPSASGSAVPDQRILMALESAGPYESAKAVRSARDVWLGVALIAVTVLIGAAVLITQQSGAPSSAPPALQSAAPSVEQATVQEDGDEADAHAVVEPEAQPQMSATIISQTEDVEGRADDVIAYFARDQSTPGENSGKKGGSAESTMKTGHNASSAKAGLGVGVAQSTGGKPARASAAKSREAAGSRSAQQNSKPGNVKKAPAQADGDVTLLSAIVAHSTDREMSGSSPTGKQTMTSERSTGGARNPVVIAKAAVLGANRDIVERMPGDTTQGLLQRCRRLGLLEGELCRWRICSGQWESDAACKVAKAP
jgi:hypothetical protein